ncbi:hypothetical protein [Nocardia asteroides]|uniref:hypothetical protein n=1 Tax=Nocardia asteroides TaxID=1824 RepID=UPI001E5E2157|nr:hypothetical protein [Nocardia asteroides]UGT53427.1 hypothetical protein LTT85_22425 [Nocardia asteroides]
MRRVIGVFALCSVLASCGVVNGRAEPDCSAGTLDVRPLGHALGDFVALQDEVRAVLARRESPITMREIGRRTGWSAEWDRMISVGHEQTPASVLIAAGIDTPMCVKGVDDFDPFSERVPYPQTVFLSGGRPIDRVEWFHPQPLIHYGPLRYVAPDTPLIIVNGHLEPS